MSLVNKYNISKKDLNQLGIIESKKKESGFFEKDICIVLYFLVN